MDWTHLQLHTKKYVTQPGDSLKKIASQFKINVREITEINNIKNSSKRLSPGQVILLPLDPSSNEAIAFSSSEAVALKIPYANSDPPCLLRNNSYDQGSRELLTDEETIEKKLVKVNAERIILDHFEVRVPIPGILVITPSMLLFDPVQLDSNMVSELGIAFPLCSIHCMKTYSNVTDIEPALKNALVKHLSEKESIINSMNEMKINSQSLLTQTHDERQPNHFPIDQATINAANAPDFCGYSSITEPPESPPSDSICLALKARKLTPSSDKQGQKSSPQLDMKESFISCLFSIDKTRIDEVFSFLLNSGVGMSESPLCKSDVCHAQYFSENLPKRSDSESTDVFDSIDSIPRKFKEDNFSICIMGDDPKNDSTGETRSRSCHTFYWDDNKSDFVASTWVMLEFPETYDQDNQSQKKKAERSVIGQALEELTNEVFQPELRHGTSDIMTDQMVTEIAKSLPLNLSCAHFLLIYQSSRDGFSLKTIYRKMEVVQSPVLLLIKDSKGNCIGAFLSERMMVSQYFYGRGDSYVFHWAPEFRAYRWTQSNNFFMKGNSDSFMIGSTSGKNAIWFDGHLKNGYSAPTDTFDNPGLVNLEEKKPCDFMIDCIETWGFVS